MLSMRLWNGCSLSCEMFRAFKTMKIGYNLGNTKISVKYPLAYVLCSAFLIFLPREEQRRKCCGLNEITSHSGICSKNYIVLCKHGWTSGYTGLTNHGRYINKHVCICSSILDNYYSAAVTQTLCLYT